MTPALADEHTDAVMMMAEATICKISVSEEAKRILYGKISSGGRTPSQVNYEIHGGIEALKKSLLRTEPRCAWRLEID